MDFLGILGLVGLVGAIFLGIAYVGSFFLILLPLALFVYIKQKRNDLEMEKFYRDRAREFVSKYKGHTVEHYYMDGTCLVEYREIRTKLLGMTDDYFILEDGYKLPLDKYLHPVD